MKRLVFLYTLLGSMVLVTGQVWAVTLSFDPSSQTVVPAKNLIQLISQNFIHFGVWCINPRVGLDARWVDCHGLDMINPDN